ncbi:hypoxanthine phosphoribosyltransferase [Flavobacterium sp. xlx-214]|uniref:hypoxanthine phosphoribosyltransferase n=1 Tax=unclassified Flavobacterium TaxID=196869 RepID=UPI0013D1DF41|nr:MULTISPECIES: hypoxanthine phosphoribosyltransferase [unclassified Flavobacterium]MBA5792773.1 hypoxanthine phosphoribosyltransferase [Flavobacterium sp. xlx-221]QMI83910.1 hypoxanthine phosphoribosyltransferase [Flavobacterium sp. xlx-214]
MEIQILDKTFVPYITASQIDVEVQRIAKELLAEYENEVPVFLVVLNGAFMFASDLMKHYNNPAELSFVKMASYEGADSTGEVTQLLGLDIDITNKHVVIIEDIVDTGTTIVALHQLINRFKIKSVKVATLFFKPEAYKKEVPIDFIGFQIENKFIVGYGLDYNKQGRNLSEIYQIK